MPIAWPSMPVTSRLPERNRHAGTKGTGDRHRLRRKLQAGQVGKARFARGNTMPIRRLIILPFLLLPLLVAAKPEPAPLLPMAPAERQVPVLRWVEQLLSGSHFHYSPRPLDDQLSQEIFKRTFDALDPERLFFLASDVEAFERYRTGFDDAIRSRNLRPVYEIFTLYRERVAERTAFARATLKSDLDFTVDQSYQLKRSEGPWETSVAALEAAWVQRVKNDVLRLKLAGREMDAIRDTLDKRYTTYESRVRELKSDDVFQTFVNAYAGAIDPHTAYMNARASENFNISMRLSLEGIGAVLQRDDEFTVIRSIVPGGPAAMSGQVKVGDRIVAVGQGREGPMVDVVGWRIDDVVELIRGPKDSYVRLDVLPAEAGLDGKHELVTIARQKVKLEEQAAKKQIIEFPDGDATRRIGIIALPTFYQDFEGRRRDEPDYRSASRDVARLLAELRTENVEGVLLDLRNNGGGSLPEAVELTGLFIDRGPVVQVRDSTGRLMIERDQKSGVAWDGPMAVMVNRQSASASEIFAAAIQDYGRGLVIGEPTFGKGTVQNLIDLDRFGGSEGPGLGQLKLTVAQFFRVDGGSTQHKGVLPDVAFPITLDAEDYGESAYENALPWTEIEALTYNRLAEFKPLVPLLAARHGERAGKDPEFRWWAEDIAEYRAQRKRTEVSLNLATRKAERDRDEARRKAREAERKAVLGETAADDAALAGDDGLQADERDIRAQLAREQAQDDKPDALAREAAHVLVDAIDLLRSDRALAGQVYPDGRIPRSN
jgi:carboxyl-terminal processing protease